MKLYLVRHGDSNIGGLDDERILSEKGKEEIQHLANFIAPLKLKVATIFHSPKRRAQQTAEILSKVIDTKIIETKTNLNPESPVTDILDEFYPSQEDFLLVGHMPFMGRLAAKLLTDNENKDIVNFKTGTMVCLEQVENEHWVICWMLAGFKC